MSSIAISQPHAALRSQALRIQDVTKVFSSNANKLVALESVSLDVRHGEFVVLVGASGCGKTTLLNLIAGLDVPTTGQILVEDRPIQGPGSDRMMMFQEHALFPWLSVLDNVIFGLWYHKDLSRSQCRERALHYLDMVELADSAHAGIHELSGGMRQRVALARALAPDPGIILFDEPFGSLDALTRERLYVQLQAVIAKTQKTCIFVTHNVREAACLGGRVIVLGSRPGRIRKIMDIPLSRPRDFYDPEVSRLGGLILHELRASECAH